MRSASTGALVYVWSPRMVMSVTQASDAAQAATQHGLDFVPLHDARVPLAEWRAALKRAPRLGGAAHQPGGSGQTRFAAHAPSVASTPKPSSASARLLRASRPLCAEQLIQNEALRHFPTAFVLTARGMHRFPIVGAMPAAFWQRSVAQRLQQAQP